MEENLLEKYVRMCANFEDCDYCPIGSHDDCHGFIQENPKKVAEIVEVWAKENPKETYLSYFLKALPDAPLNSNGSPKTCPYRVIKGAIRECDDVHNCLECWNREYTPPKE